MNTLSSSKTQKRIADLPNTHKPIEKIITKGKENLSNTDLLAILLNTGTNKQNALVLAATIEKKFSMQKLPDIMISQLTTIPGIGKTKAARILAAIELGQRLFSPQQLTTQKILTTQDAVTHLSNIANKKQEHIIVLYNNARDELIQKETIAIGTLNAALIEPRDIFAPALNTPCAGIIIAHNHPSGDPTPSDDDLAFTNRIHEASKILGITLLDHLILSPLKFYSFRENIIQERTK